VQRHHFPVNDSGVLQTRDTPVATINDLVYIISQLKCPAGLSLSALGASMLVSYSKGELIFTSKESEEKCFTRALNFLDNAVVTFPNWKIGFVYFASTPAFPGLLKIGYTTKADPRQRMQTLQTTLPYGDMILEHTFFMEFPELYEGYVHKALKKHRVSVNREWFRFHSEDFEEVFKFLKNESLPLGDLVDVKDNLGWGDLANGIEYDYVTPSAMTTRFIKVQNKLATKDQTNMKRKRIEDKTA
jgi:hypothetical protein